MGPLCVADNLPIFPGEILRLHLFEPRYRLMMKRIVNSSRRSVIPSPHYRPVYGSASHADRVTSTHRFAYVPNYSNYLASSGDVALVAELKEVQFTRDGRSQLEAKIVGRYTVVVSGEYVCNSSVAWSDTLWV
jgi:hypothetical protein